MLVVVDSNIVISSLISKGITSTILFTNKLDFISPSFMLDEVGEHLNELALHTGIPEDDLSTSLESLKPQIKIFPISSYIEFLEKSMHLVPDPDDIDFFALALKMDCPVWSYDSHFIMQSEVKILSTGELLKLLRSL